MLWPQTSPQLQPAAPLAAPHGLPMRSQCLRRVKVGAGPLGLKPGHVQVAMGKCWASHDDDDEEKEEDDEEENDDSSSPPP